MSPENTRSFMLKLLVHQQNTLGDEAAQNAAWEAAKSKADKFGLGRIVYGLSNEALKLTQPGAYLLKIMDKKAELTHASFKFLDDVYNNMIASGLPEDVALLNIRQVSNLQQSHQDAILKILFPDQVLDLDAATETRAMKKAIEKK